MNDALENRPRARRAAAHAETVRKPLKHALVLGVVGLVCVLGYQSWKLREGSARPPARSAAVDGPVHDGQPAGQPPDAVQPEDGLETGEGAGPVAPATIQAGSGVVADVPARARTPRPEPTPYTRQLVTNLTQPGLGRQPLTAEQAEQWTASLQSLVQQGSGAVSAIAEFLELNRDWDLGPGSPLGYPSMRAALLDALRQIDGPEAQGLMAQTLATTSVPSEIAWLARSLEQQAPGQFREQIATAVRETLGQAASGQLCGWDVGPLFQVLQTYGDGSVVPDLEKNASRWSYYSALTLANLPSGEGIPALIRLAQQPPGGGSRGVALEALAQVAVQYPAASAALLELARATDFPERSWVAAASAIGGERFFIRDTAGESAPPPLGSGVRNYHLEASNQNFYSTPAWGGMSDEQINQRMTILDQLLAVSSSPTVARALQNARALLLTKGQQASAN